MRINDIGKHFMSAEFSKLAKTTKQVRESKLLEGTPGCSDCEYIEDETDGMITTCDECAAEMNEAPTDQYSASNSRRLLVQLDNMQSAMEKIVNELYGSDNGDLQDQITTMDKYLKGFNAVIARAMKVVPNESIEEGRMSMRQLASMDKDKARKIEAMVGPESKYDDMGDYQEALYRAAMKMGLIRENNEDDFRDGHDLELLKQVSAQIAQDVANNDYTAIDDLLKNVSEAEMRGFLSEMESTVNELIISKPAKRSKDDDEYEVDSKFPNLKTKKRPSHFDRRKALARMVPKMQNILSNVGEMDLTKEQLHGVLSKASKLMIEIAIAQKQEVVENLYSLNKDDVMKSEILVKGVGRYSVEGLMKNISEKLQDLSNESNSMEPFNYKNIKSKLDSGIVNVMLDSLIQAYDDLENARRKGGAASRSIPKDIFDDVMLQELEITQGTALKVLDNVANRSDKKPFPIRMKDGTVIDVSPALANEIINMYDSGGDVMQKKIMGLLSSGLGFKKLIDAAKQKNRTLR